jgi:DnaJ-domain-containing protein 1
MEKLIGFFMFFVSTMSFAMEWTQVTFKPDIYLKNRLDGDIAYTSRTKSMSGILKPGDLYLIGKDFRPKELLLKYGTQYIDTNDIRQAIMSTINDIHVQELENPNLNVANRDLLFELHFEPNSHDLTYTIKIIEREGAYVHKIPSTPMQHTRDPFDEFPGTKEIKNKKNQSAAILGVNLNADKSAIKKAYFFLARKWHPDKWTHAPKAEQDYAEAVFKVIHEAYEYLSS